MNRDHLLGFPPVLKLIDDAPPAARALRTPAREKPSLLDQRLAAVNDCLANEALTKQREAGIKRNEALPREAETKRETESRLCALWLGADCVKIWYENQFWFAALEGGWINSRGVHAHERLAGRVAIPSSELEAIKWGSKCSPFWAQLHARYSNEV